MKIDTWFVFVALFTTRRFEKDDILVDYNGETIERIPYTTYCEMPNVENEYTFEIKYPPPPPQAHHRRHSGEGDTSYQYPPGPALQPRDAEDQPRGHGYQAPRDHNGAQREENPRIQSQVRDRTANSPAL